MSISANLHPTDCAEGEISIHPSSEQAGGILEAALLNDRGIGISSAVVIDGEIVFARAFGSAGKDFILGPNTRMRTGSIAKLFTAVAAARLVEMNLLDLNEPVAAIVPEILNEMITSYQLGTHTSGIRHYDFQKMAEANNRKRYQSLTDALQIFSSDPLLFEPGTEFHYSSYGFNLLGVVVERTYGASYEVALHDLVAKPLELSSIVFDDIEAEIPCRSSFNTMVFGRIRINAPWRDNSDLYPSGGLLVSASDLAIFTDAIFNSDFLQPRTVELFTKPVMTPDGKLTGYSFGWQIGRSNKGTIEWYGHGGQINGAYASVRYYPASQMTVVGMTNYNYWLTSRSPKFFDAVREELPTLLGDP